MKRRHRLRRSSEFARLRKEGKRFAGRFLVLSVIETACEKEFQTAVITGKRVGAAVVRNLLRRRLRCIVDRQTPLLAGGRRYVSILRPASASATFQELEREWVSLARRAGLIRESQ
ncbi:MAG TPA: ribonuclease P protein component [Verrucomicrobiales bacterium]|nr:ribonuclease P protein component [Verrucomicrobiales bacterium]